jgi:hypothetical protein
VHFGIPIRKEVALERVLELLALVAAGATVLRPDVARADAKRLE